jgi:hypothetical protein
MSSTFTRTVTCALGDSDRKRFLTRDSKRLARMYGGTFASQVDPFAALRYHDDGEPVSKSPGQFAAEYRVTYPVSRLLAATTALRRRKGR